MLIIKRFLYQQLFLLLLPLDHAGSKSVEVTEVDIAIPPPERGNDAEKRSALRDLGKIWQDRKVPYIISPVFDSMYLHLYEIRT